MSFILSLDNDEDKSNYLKRLFNETYIKDIVERNNILRVDILEKILNILLSSVGSLVNAQKLYNTFISNGEKEPSLNTISSYLKYMEDAFLITKVERFDIKRKNTK